MLGANPQRKQPFYDVMQTDIIGNLGLLTWSEIWGQKSDLNQGLVTRLLIKVTSFFNRLQKLQVGQTWDDVVIFSTKPKVSKMVTKKKKVCVDMCILCPDRN